MQRAGIIYRLFAIGYNPHAQMAPQTQCHFVLYNPYHLIIIIFYFASFCIFLNMHDSILSGNLHCKSMSFCLWDQRQLQESHTLCSESGRLDLQAVLYEDVSSKPFHIHGYRISCENPFDF